MPRRLAGLLLPSICLGAIAAAPPPTAAAAPLVGISDNSPAMFHNRYFLRLNLPIARDMVEWNAAVMRSKAALRQARAWIDAAEADGVQPMISFTADGGRAGNYIPSVSVYTRAIRAFIHDFPQVKVYTAWNEPDWVYRPGIARNPGLAAAYFNALVRNCRGCTVVAGDLYLPAPQLAAWVRAYERDLRYRPVAWALHPYYDVRTHTTAQVTTMLRLTRGQLWLDEISGVERRGHWQFKNQSPAAAARDEAFIFTLAKRFPRITRIYHYQWQGTVAGPDTGWDSGLLGPKGVPRPAYWVVAREVGPRHATP